MNLNSLLTAFYLFLSGLALKNQIFSEEPALRRETQHLRQQLQKSAMDLVQRGWDYKFAFKIKISAVV